MQNHFRMFADYNTWANRLVYEAAAQLSDSEYRAETGAFFGSLHRTLNHILVADRAWMKRFTKEGEVPPGLDAILYENLTSLTAARIAEDKRISDWIYSLGDSELQAFFSYSPMSSTTVYTQPLCAALAHVFNHQTHHRGQVHSILTSLGKPSLALDMAWFLRAEGVKWTSQAS